MRYTRLALVVTIFFLVPLLTTSVGRAESSKWCAVLGSGMDARNCGFVSFEQCMASTGGTGGFCERDYTATPAATSSRKPKRKRVKN